LGKQSSGGKEGRGVIHVVEVTLGGQRHRTMTRPNERGKEPGVPKIDEKSEKSQRMGGGESSARRKNIYG